MGRNEEILASIPPLQQFRIINQQTGRKTYSKNTLKALIYLLILNAGGPRAMRQMFDQSPQDVWQWAEMGHPPTKLILPLSKILRCPPVLLHWRVAMIFFEELDFVDLVWNETELSEEQKKIVLGLFKEYGICPVTRAR